MATKFIMPVSLGGATPVTKGDHDFHQPIRLKPANTISGIEVFLPDNDPDKRLYACFDGKLTWKDAGGGQANRIELLIDSKAALALQQVGKTVESRPNRIVYENVERNGARASLTSVVIEAYRAANTTPKTQWRPVMLQQHKSDDPADTKPINVKQFMDSHGGESFATNIVDEFLTGVSDLAVRAGDNIGNADLRNASVDPSVARQLLFYTLDMGDQFINPLYYLYLYFIIKSSQVTVTDTISHPLFTAFTAEFQNPPLPRIPVTVSTGTEDELALDKLSNPHQTPRAKIKWFYNADLQLEVEGEGPFVPTAQDTSLVKSVWTQHGTSIAQFCSKFQVPCEVVTAIVSGESAGNSKAFRFEPMDRPSLAKALASQPALMLKYDKMLGAHIVNYVPTRQPLPKDGAIELAPVTRLAVTTDEDVQLTKNGQIKASNSRSVFLVDDVWRPVLSAFVTTAGKQKNHQVDVKEELFLHQLTQGGTTTVTTARAGRIRVLRAQLTKAAATDLDITLSVSGSTPLSVQIPKGRLNPTLPSSGQIDVTGGDTVTIDVQPADASVALKVAWFLGVAGDDGATVPANMWIIPDGNGSASPTIYNAFPDPFDRNLAVRKDRTDMTINMTWGEVEDLISATGGSFLSPGAAQNLVSTAFGILQRVESMAPGLRAEMGIPTVATAGELLSSGFMTNARNALFVGIATMRIHYNTAVTRFDLPYVHGWFFGGGPLALDKDKTRWGMSTPAPDFIDLLGRRYNAAIEFFKGPVFPNPLPTVRLF
jgi:hypothetical protein